MEKKEEIQGSLIVDLMALGCLPQLLREQSDDYSIPKNIFKAAIKVINSKKII